MNLNALSLVELGAFPKFRVRVPNSSKFNHASCFFNPNVKMPPRSQSSRSLIISLPSNACLSSFLHRDSALRPRLRATTKDDDDDDTGDESSSDDEDSDLWKNMSQIDPDYVHYGLIYYNVLVLVIEINYGLHDVFRFSQQSCQITWMMKNNSQIPERAKKDSLSCFQRIIKRFRTSDVRTIKSTSHYKIAELFLKQKCSSHSYILSVMKYLPSTQEAEFINDVAVELMLMEAIDIVNLDVLSNMTEEISDLILMEDDYAPNIASSTSTSKFTVAQCALELYRELHVIDELEKRLSEKFQFYYDIPDYLENVEDNVVAHGLWPRLVHDARLSLSETYDCIIEMKDALQKINSRMKRFGLLICECMSFYDFKEQKMKEQKISTMEIEDFEKIQETLKLAEDSLEDLLPNPNMVKSACEITNSDDMVNSFLGFKLSLIAYKRILGAMKTFNQKISEAQVTRRG